MWPAAADGYSGGDSAIALSAEYSSLSALPGARVAPG